MLVAGLAAASAQEGTLQEISLPFHAAGQVPDPVISPVYHILFIRDGVQTFPFSQTPLHLARKMFGTLAF